jgi:mRNA interferase MazF
MVIRRGDVCWADLGDHIGSEPGYRRPVLVVQDDPFNASRLATVIVLSLTSNLTLRSVPGCVLLTKEETGLDRDSVVNATQIKTINRERLEAGVGRLDGSVMFLVDNSLRQVLGL